MNKAVINIMEAVSPIDPNAAGVTRISKGQTLKLAVRGESTLACVAGQLWVTKRGERADYILGAGDSLAIAEPLVVTALHNGAFSLN